MYGVIKVLLFISMVLCLTTVSTANSGGLAIPYDPPYTPSTCFGSKDKGVMIAKVHSSSFGNGAACGKRYRVRCLGGTNKAIRDACTGNTVDITIVGSCETCFTNALVLSKEAFAKIARLPIGIVTIEYEQI